MLFFKKRVPEQMPSIGKGFTPSERVRELSSKGFSETEIIDVLRKEGFSPDEIDRSLTDALRSGISGGNSQPTPPTPTPALPTIEQLVPKQEQFVMPESSLPQPTYQGYSPEEYIDYIVGARTAEIDEGLNEVMIKQGELERKITEVYEKLNSLSQARITEQQLLMGRIDNFKETIEDVSAKINSLEKAFKETLPALIEAVRVLSDLVQRLKREA